MVWMEVDAMLRQKSGGTKSIDDFARAFFGMRDGDWGELTYTFDDVAATLNGDRAVRLGGVPAPAADRDGQARADRRLRDERLQAGLHRPSRPATSSRREKTRGTDLSYSLGLVVDKDAARSPSVIWDSPAFKAGLDVGTTIVAVNGEAYTADRLKAAIVAAKGTKEPIRLLVKNGDALPRRRASTITAGPAIRASRRSAPERAGSISLLAPR